MKKNELPFHVVKKSHNDVHAGYDIYLLNVPFLKQCDSHTDTYRLKRHEAYAIVKLLNKERPELKWADKFSDPY